MNSIFKQAQTGQDDYSVGIFKQSSGTFMALTSYKSKEFKTYNGAVKFMQKLNVRGF